jgi:penicillin V acylase-like amidase (Ntn superfamily)
MQPYVAEIVSQLEIVRGIPIMNRFISICATFTVIAGMLASDVFACTTFCLKNKGEVLFGKNYDWMIGDGIVFVNRRGVSKWSMLESEKNVAKWTSKYGSVTFNQYGWESPSGGMNEAGLVIELMWLDDTKYPKPDTRPAIDVLEWIQFNLDTAATTAEVIANAETVRIASRIDLHYLVNDRQGNSATIEFLDGKLIAHTGEKLAVPTLANDTYERSLTYSRSASIDGAKSESSLDRFTRASIKTKEFSERSKSEKDAVDYAFGILADVAQKNSTQWSIVYDQKRGRIYFRTRQATQIKSIDTKAFDYSCSSPVKLFDMNSDAAGDVTGRFRDYTRKANRDLIERAFTGTDFLRDVPASVKDRYAADPEKFSCGSGSPMIVPETKQIATTVAAVTLLDLVFPLYYIYKQVASS